MVAELPENPHRQKGDESREKADYRRNYYGHIGVCIHCSGICKHQDLGYFCSQRNHRHE